MALPELWHFQISHFCEKARWALDYKGIAHKRTILAASYIGRALFRTGKPTLPILVLDGQYISDSTRIIETLEARWPEVPLYPEDPVERKRALALEDFFDEHLGHQFRAAALMGAFQEDPQFIARFATMGLSDNYRRVFRALVPIFTPFYRARHNISEATAESGAKEVEAVMDRIQAELQPSGYLVGDAFSVADLTAASLLGAGLRAPEYAYPLPQPLPASLEAYGERLKQHPVSEWVYEMFRRHRGKSAEASV